MQAGAEQGQPDGVISAAWDSAMHAEFYDPRLVAIYDTVNPIAEYSEFYLHLAATLAASSIIDLGCGTGLVTCELAGQGHRMIGVEPSSAMLNLARRRCHERVQWIEGNALHLGDVQADLAIMTGHVAQFFLDEADWRATLAAIHKALRPGGRVAFESRNPNVQPWVDNRVKSHIDWPAATSRRTAHDPVAGPLEWWFHVAAVNGDRVRGEIHYLFAKSGDELISVNELIFRSRAELSRSLGEAGFSVESIYGDWDRRPADAASPEMIFVAARA